MRSPRLGAGVACAAALGLAAPASASADVGVVAIAVPGAPVPESRLSAAMAGAGEASGDRPVRAADTEAQGALRAGALPRTSLERFRRARELADEGWRAYLQVSGDFAAARLGRARSEAEELLPWEGGREAYADIALRLGAVLDHLGRRGEAAEVLRLAGALDPARPVTTAEFSPDVVAAFDAARAQTPPSVATRVAVTSTGGGELRGATIEIDGQIGDGSAGRPVGRPVELAAGQHVAVARAPGHRPRGVTFAVAAPRADLSIALDEDPDAAALAAPLTPGTGEDAAARTVDAIAVYAEVDAIVIAAAVWRQGRPALLGQWCAGTPARCSAIVEVEYASAPGGIEAAAAALWRELRGAPRRYPPTLPSDPRVARQERRPPGAGSARRRWYRSPWMWAGVGAAAVAIGATAAVLASGDDGTVVVVDPGDFGGEPR